MYMNSKTTVTISEARKKIFEIAEEVQKPGVSYTLTESGKPKVVVLSYEEYESLIETVEVVHDHPNLANDMKESRQAYQNGAYAAWVSLEELLAKDGFVLAEKAKKQYGIPAQNKAQRPKETRKSFGGRKSKD